MAKVSLRVEGLDKAIRELQNFPKKKAAEIVQELDRTTLAIESQAKRNLTDNGSVDTGRLRASIVRQATGEYSRTVGTNVEYAPGVEFGTAPHLIVPKRAKALKTPFGFFKKVKHPGSRPKPFLFPAAESQRAQFIANMTVILSRP